MNSNSTNASQMTKQNQVPNVEQQMENSALQPAEVENNTSSFIQARTKTLGEHNTEQLQKELSSASYAQGVQNSTIQNALTNYVVDLSYVLSQQTKQATYGDKNWKLAEIHFIQPTERNKWRIWFVIDDTNYGLLTHMAEVNTFNLSKILFRVDFPITRGFANTAEVLGRKLFVKFENQSNGNGYSTVLVDTRSLHFMPNF